MVKQLIIPHFTLTTSEESELVEAVKNKATQLHDYYAPIYKKIERSRAAKNVENAPGDLLPNVTFDESEEKKSSRPNVHLSYLKSIANSGISELVEGIFTSDFLTFVAVDKDDKEFEKDISDAFNAIREETRTDEKERQIIENIFWYGTSPIVITNEGRHNVIHELMEVRELELTPEQIQLITEIEGRVIGSKLIIKQQPIEFNGDNFEALVITFEDGSEFLGFADSPETNESCFDKARDTLMEKFNIDLRYAQVVSQEVITREDWIDGLPRPKVLNILHTFCDPAAVNDNPDTMNWVYEEHKRTQELVDDPNFINRDKLKNGEGSNQTLKGSTNLDTKNISSYKNTTENLITSEPIVKFKQAYFDTFTFKTSGKILRNFLVSTVEDDTLVECRPNISTSEVSGKKISKNPLILVTYTKAVGDNIGTCPIFDALDLSKTCQILVNFALDSMARNGNKYVYDTNCVDIKTVDGGTATMVSVDMDEARNYGVNNVNQVFQNLPGNSNDAMNILNATNMIKDQLQQVSNTAMPHFENTAGETATKVAAISARTSGIIKSVISHICKSLCDMYQRQFDDCVERGVKIELVPSFDMDSKQHVFKTFDFALLKGKKFVAKITSVNPDLNKNVQLSVIQQTLTMALSSGSPELKSRANISELAQKFLQLSGLDDPNLVRNDEDAQKWLIENDIKEKLYAQYIAEQQARENGQGQNAGSGEQPSDQPTDEGSNFVPAA